MLFFQNMLSVLEAGGGQLHTAIQTDTKTYRHCVKKLIFKFRLPLNGHFHGKFDTYFHTITPLFIGYFSMNEKLGVFW